MKKVDFDVDKRHVMRYNSNRLTKEIKKTMKYKTVIEVVTEAANKDDAMNIVGEYLSGDILSSVDMKYSTRSISGLKTAAITITALSIAICIGVFSLHFMKSSGTTFSAAVGSSAVQAPLHTQALNVGNVYFKDQWQKEHIKEALLKISKSK